ncbi:helix-turn-helix domain-containing protein [Candidatus Saccharibacteria bacterium]|nr:helix-turn-helix domain-containing protein [Candidatus Saccharibacteria bacterium]
MERKIRHAFSQSLAKISSEKEMERYIFDLLTPTEQIMLAKRLAIAALLVRGLSYQEISKRLKVSTSTVARVNLWLRASGAGYRRAVESIGDWKPLV